MLAFRISSPMSSESRRTESLYSFSSPSMRLSMSWSRRLPEDVHRVEAGVPHLGGDEVHPGEDVDGELGHVLVTYHDGRQRFRGAVAARNPTTVAARRMPSTRSVVLA